METNRTVNLNTYIQGSVWRWEQSDYKMGSHREGVQSSGRPVLIVSNNRHNQWSSSVNCLSITSVLKDSPVHVSITLDVPSHIQCEQWHTIPKNELTEYIGVIPAIILSSVKEKIKIQSDMNTDRSLEILTDIKDSLDEIISKSADGFGLHTVAKDISQLLINTNNCFTYIKATLENMQVSNEPSQSTNAESVEQSKAPSVASSPIDKPLKRGKRSDYSDEDIKIIIDGTKPVDELVEMFSLKNRGSVYSLRTYFRKKLEGQENTAENNGGTQNQRRTYTEADIQFIVDETNTIASIVDRFNYKDKDTASKMRSYFRKKLRNAK